MVRIVINEWIFHDLMGENGENRRRESTQFLERLADSQDVLVVMIGTPWTRKAIDLLSHGDMRTRLGSKTLHLKIIQSSRKCLLLSHCVPLMAPAVADARSKAKAEDRYLVDAYIAGEAEVLVTSDAPLQDILAKVLKVQDRDAFLRLYLA
jgi:hypothetical protein